MPSPHSHVLDGADENASHTHPPTKGSDMGIKTCSACMGNCTCSDKLNPATSLSKTISNSPKASSMMLSADPFIDQSVPQLSSTHPSLKIKLTLPTKHSSHSHKTSRNANGLGKQLKKISKKDGETTYAEGNGGGPSMSAGSPVSAEGSSPTVLPLGPLPVPSTRSAVHKKKRGRPTKAIVAARAAQRQAPAPSGSGTTKISDADVVFPANITHVTASRPQKKITTSIHSNLSKSKRSKLLGVNKNRGRHSSVATGRSRTGNSSQFKRKNIIHVLDDESSDLSELDDDESNDIVPYGLPTFVQAISSCSNTTSSESDSDSDTSKSRSGSNHASLRGSRDNSPPKDEDLITQRKRGNHLNWNVRMRRRESGSVGPSEDEMETSEAEEEVVEEEAVVDEEIEDLGYPQLTRYSGIATGWTDDEESSFDADIFFANLTDTESSAYVSDDEQMGDAENGFGEDGQDDDDEADAMDIEPSSPGFDVMRLSEMAAAGFLAPFSDLERGGAGPSWEQLISSNIKETLPNLDARQAREAYLSSRLEMTVPGYKEAEAMMGTSEEEEAVAMFDNCSQDLDVDEEDGLVLFEESDGGETTEDEFVDVNGIATPRREVLLRFPASLGAIDPMSTVSSPVRPLAKVSEKRSRKLANPKTDHEKQKAKKKVPKPCDILAGKVFEDSEKENVDLSSSPKAPAMGNFFHRPSDSTKTAVIAAHSSQSDRPIPCPYPITSRRWRGRGGSLSAISHSGSDRSFLSRPSSFLSSHRSPCEPVPQTQESSEDSETHMRDSIRLDDVFDTTLLEATPSDVPAPPENASTSVSVGAHALNSDRTSLDILQRWDRVPISSFRNSRNAGEDVGIAEKLGIITRTPQATRLSDGFSYGSAMGGMLRGSPLSTALWESTGSASSKDEQVRTATIDKMSSLLLSPALLPARDDNKTPTADSHQKAQQQQQGQDQDQEMWLGFETHSPQQHIQSQRQQHHAENLRSRKEMRKEKKRNKKFFGGPPPHIRHNHFPNARGRSSGSMQRSGSVPSLNI